MVSRAEADLGCYRQDAFAASYRNIARNPRAVAARDESEKKAKFRALLDEFCLVSIAIDTRGVWGEDAFKSKHF